MLIIFFQVVYSQLDSIGGWNYEEVLFLNGITILSSQIMLAVAFVFNIYRLPFNIRKGDIDFMLLKPMNSQFTITLGKVYFGGLVGTLTGMVLIIVAYLNLDIVLTPLTVIVGLVTFICGQIIYYSIVVSVSSLSFKFVNNNVFPKLAQRLTRFGRYPHTIYNGFSQKILLTMLPVMFISSIPASIFLHGINWVYLVTAIITAIISLSVSNMIWNYMIRFYTSASS